MPQKVTEKDESTDMKGRDDQIKTNHKKQFDVGLFKV